MWLNTIWFALFVLIIAGYLILDGFDLGVGILHMFVAKDDQERRIAAVAALDQPLRRDLYRLLVGADGWVTRDDAASALGIPRSVAAFHLDKLADAGVVAGLDLAPWEPELGSALLVCTTELATREAIDRLVALLAGRRA